MILHWILGEYTVAIFFLQIDVRAIDQLFFPLFNHVNTGLSKEKLQSHIHFKVFVHL